jgi:NAD(P)-dependent dehydrogenase (short-subunit alcohol dehydrogenase family)
MDLGLRGKKAIVTGGTRGIGRAIVELLAEEGCDLALCARGRAGVDDAAAALAGKGVKAYGGVVDVADTMALRAWVAEAAEALGGLDVFIANVSALAQAMDEDSWRRSFDIDVMGTVAGVEAAIPFLEQSSAGAIVVIGTTGAVEIAGAPRPYASVKAALIPYVKALAPISPPRGCAPTWSRPATSISRAGCGTCSRRTIRSCSRPWSGATRWAAWARRKRSPTPSSLSPARAPASSPAPT